MPAREAYRADPPRKAPPSGPGSLRLEEALSLAERLHPDLAVARARVEAAEGRVAQAGRLPNPELLARVESAPFEGGTSDDAELLAGVRQTLPAGGRLGAAERVEGLERERRSRELEVRRLEVRLRVMGAFGTALYAEEVVKLLAESLRHAERATAVTAIRAGAGDALPEDSARAEMERARAGLELQRARSQRDASFVALASAIGDSSIRIESAEGPLEDALAVPALDSVIAALETTATASLGKSEVAVERARVELARAERIPDVNLELFYRRSGPADADMFDAGLGVTLPLFDRNGGRIREAEAEVEAARARARSARNDLERGLREAHAKLSRAAAQSRVLREEILPRAATVLQGHEARYAGGDLSLADLLPVRRERIALQLSYLESLRDVREAWSFLQEIFSHR
jgi:cobalt-zinc-cadmium efflux system outer membrane protein